MIRKRDTYCANGNRPALHPVITLLTNIPPFFNFAGIPSSSRVALTLFAFLPCGVSVDWLASTFIAIPKKHHSTVGIPNLRRLGQTLHRDERSTHLGYVKVQVAPFNLNPEFEEYRFREKFMKGEIEGQFKQLSTSSQQVCNSAKRKR